MPNAMVDLLDAAGQGPVVVYLNPPELPTALLRFGRRRLIGRLVIGCWAWELPRPPAAWRFAFDHVHEVWVPSQFVAEAVKSLGDATPVRVAPHPVETPVPIPGLRARLGLPQDSVLVLTVADTRSSFARKNPQGALRAFGMAVGDDAAAHLVIKVSGAHSDPDTVAALQRDVAGRRNVSVIARDLTPGDMGGLVASADIVLSLHRAEGFGLSLAAAMAAGKPVIATGWSGNLEFMDSESSVLVPYRLVPVYDPQGIYEEEDGQRWAAPDLEAAASSLRRCIFNPLYRADLGVTARARARAVLSTARFGRSLGGAFWTATNSGKVPDRG